MPTEVPPSEAPDKRSAERLDSWKEIAVYLKREVRTVQRWEKSEGLPVHRHQHEKQGSVYAYRAELDSWWHQRQRSIETDDVAPEMPGKVEREPARVSRRRWPVLLLIGSLVMIAAAAIYAIRDHSRPVAGPKTTIAVLPLKDLSSSPDPSFAPGLTEEMIARLTRADPARLGVVALTSSYASTASSDIARKFHAEYVLQGTVRHDERRVAITAELLRAQDRRAVWANSYERPLQDVLRLQNDVATAISREALSSLTPGLHQPAPEVNGDAYIAYLKGRYFWNKRSTESLLKAVDFFQEAIARDPDYALPYAGLADSYNLLGSAGYAAMRPGQAFPRAKAAAEKALQLDPTLAEAHVSLGYAKLVYGWDVSGAETEFKRALELNPNYPTAHQFYAYSLIAAGNLDEAAAEGRKAQELDPLSPVITSAVGETYYFARQFDRSIEEEKKALELDPNFALGAFNLARAYGAKGMHEEAIALLQQSLARSPEDLGLLSGLAHEYGAAGHRNDAERILRQVREMSGSHYVPAMYFAAIYTGLGDKTGAIAALSQARMERCDYFIYVAQEPMADPLRDDPRFQQLIREVGLPR